MGDTAHDRQICEIVKPLLERQYSDTLILDGHPEDEDRNKEGVEVRYRGRSNLYFFEHTLLENYPGQTYDDKIFEEILEPLEKKLSGTLPKPGSYLICAELTELTQIKRTERQAAIEQLKAWILNEADTICIADPNSKCRHQTTTTISGITFKLSRWGHGEPGSLKAGRFAFDDPEGEKFQIRRLEKAFVDKCPKLIRAKSDPSDVSVLILEVTNWALCSAPMLYEVFESVARGISSPLPDYIYLFENYDYSREYYVWPLKTIHGIQKFSTALETRFHRTRT